MKNEFRAPYRLVERNPNPVIGTNVIFGEISDELEQCLGEIIDSVDLLEKAYVTERYPSKDAQSGTMNTMNPGLFCANLVSRWHQAQRKWRPVRNLTVAARELTHATRDIAELHFVDWLYRLARYAKQNLNAKAANPQAPPLPERRILFLQAGIGTGKTTMLHHCASVLLPHIRGADVCPVDFLPIILDFKDVPIGARVDRVWRAKMEAARKAVEVYLDSSGVEDIWRAIAEQELYLPSGRLIPEIREARYPRRARAKIVRQSSKANVFLARAAAFLARRTVPTVVTVVLDNMEKHDYSTERQLAFIGKLIDFLSETRGAIGVVSVREYTLGNMSHLDAFRSQRHIERQHITAPYIGDMLQKRLNLCMAKLDDPAFRQRTVAIAHGTQVTVSDIKGLLKRVYTSFREERRMRVAGVARTQLAPSKRPSIPGFLHGATDSNCRAALDLVIDALNSWAVATTSVVVHYLDTRDNVRRPELPPLTFDEIVRLSMVEQRQYYDSGYHTWVANVFSWGGRRPEAEHGRFPSLVKYRLMQLLDNAGGPVRVSDLRKIMSIFEGYAGSPLEELLHEFLEQGFVESEEGNDLAKITRLARTRKLIHYLHLLSKTLVYLENVRNDAVIDYATDPHECRQLLAHDLVTVVQFIDFIYRQEKDEYAYVRMRSERRPSILARYAKMARVQPICFKLLRSVCDRVNQLVRNEDRGKLLAAELARHRDAILDTYGGVRSGIMASISSGELYPPLSAGIARRLYLDI